MLNIQTEMPSAPKTQTVQFSKGKTNVSSTPSAFKDKLILRHEPDQALPTRVFQWLFILILNRLQSTSGHLALL